MLNGYGGIRLNVRTSPAPRLNGALMRGFGLRFDGRKTFDTTRSVQLGGVRVSRAIHLDQRDAWGRWLDTFTNTTKAPITIDVAFGGQTGYGATGTNHSEVVGTSSGDPAVSPQDSWTVVVSGTAAGQTTGGPSATVIGDPAPFAGAMNRTGNWLRDTFTKPQATSGHDANFQAYINALTLKPGQSGSLLHYVVVGKQVTTATVDAEIGSVAGKAAALAERPVLDGLSATQICSVANFAALSPSGHHGKAGTARVHGPCRSLRCLLRPRRSPRRPTTWWTRRSRRCRRT